MAKEKDKQVNLKLDEETAQGTYANFAILNHSPDEFILDFVMIQPGGKQGKVNHRAILSPGHAKRFLGALQNNIQKYEEKFGPIKVNAQTAPVILPSEDEIN
jgi:hypothetical protein